MKKIGILILIAFILGIFRVFMVYTPVGINITSLLNINWYYYILIFIFTFYLTLTIHELGHLFSFVVNKVKIKALYLTFIVFVKLDNKWRLQLYFPLAKLLGGLVVPDLKDITNDEEYEKTKNVFIKTLLAAPIVTYSYFGLAVLFIIVFSFFIKPTFLTSFLYIHFLFVIPISILYIMSFKLNTNNMYGDLVATKMMKTDELFAFAQLNQYIGFSSKISKETNEYFYNKVVELIKTQRNFYNFFARNLLLVYLTKVVEDEFKANKEVNDIINKLNFFNFKKDELTISLIHTLVLYFYLNNDVNKAYELFFKVKEVSNNLDKKFIKYMNNKTAHLINYENNSIFLNNDDNIYIGDYWIFKPLFPNLYSDLKKSHQILKYQPYICEVYSEMK